MGRVRQGRRRKYESIIKVSIVGKEMSRDAFKIFTRIVT